MTSNTENPTLRECQCGDMYIDGQTGQGGRCDDCVGRFLSELPRRACKVCGDELCPADICSQCDGPFIEPKFNPSIEVFLFIGPCPPWNSFLDAEVVFEEPTPLEDFEF